MQYLKSYQKNKIPHLLIYRVCVQRVTKYQKGRIKRDRYFVNKVETQLREKPFRGSQTQEIHYWKTKLIQRQ
jgi:hypothetical protein